MKDFWFELGKIAFYWVYGAFYIALLMFASWIWRAVSGRDNFTLLDLFISAALVFVPIVVGKTMTAKD